ncbi:MAG: hypothetical protein ACK2UH_08420 [Candidatus Promineifilaceae bacterium]
MIELNCHQAVGESISPFDAHPDLLDVWNGIWDLVTGTLLQHDPKLLIIQQTLNSGLELTVLDSRLPKSQDHLPNVILPR